MTDSPRYPPPTGDGPSGPRASFGRRLGALVIDSILVSVVIVVLTIALRAAGYGLGILIALAYSTYFEGSGSGQTIGKRALGIRVLDYGTGRSIGYGRALVRYLGRILSSIPCLLGYFWMLWDREKQTWHDKIAGSVVVPVSHYPVGAWPG